MPSLNKYPKIVFYTIMDNFYYSIMSFGLKNAGATYLRAMTVVFHYMMGKEVEDYIDHLVIKFSTKNTH